MFKKNVLIACGGFTSEHDISLKSGQTVKQCLSEDRWNVYLLEISKNQWILTNTSGQEFTFSVGDFSWEIKGKKQRADVVFNAIHGAPGENGQLAALLELLKIPHTSCNSYTAALTNNKRDCLSVLREKGISTAKHLYLDQGMLYSEDLIAKTLGFPLFVKANRAGSSFGVFKVNDLMALNEAIRKAYLEDTQLLLESALEGREVSVGAYKNSEGIQVLPITEIITENDFFDYEAKYEGKAKEITPAQLPEDWESLVNRQMKAIYKILNLNGLIRSEFIFVGGIPHLLEINTVPGMTEASIIPKQVAARGLELGIFFESQLELALLKK